ncbi:MAG: DNA-binding response regulator [Planctomycetia bacterium]|nr:DNA-binding response regulator [Planctomycetia bacterium]
MEVIPEGRSWRGRGARGRGGHNRPPETATSQMARVAADGKPDTDETYRRDRGAGMAHVLARTILLLLVYHHAVMRAGLAYLSATNADIARLLGITTHTVKVHVAGILTKLGVRDRTQAVAKAFDLGLLAARSAGRRA